MCVLFSLIAKKKVPKKKLAAAFIALKGCADTEFSAAAMKKAADCGYGRLVVNMIYKGWND